MIGEQEDQEERLMDSGKFLKKDHVIFSHGCIYRMDMTYHSLLAKKPITILDHYIIGVLSICPFTYEYLHIFIIKVIFRNYSYI